MGLLSNVFSKFSRRSAGVNTNNNGQPAAHNFPYSGHQIAGVFIFIGVVALMGVSLKSHQTQSASNQASEQSRPAAISLDLEDQKAANPVPDNSAASTATSVTSNTQPDGTVKTEVTVNGQPVSLPNDGVSQPASPTGNSSVNISNNQVTNSSNNSGYSSSNVHSYSSSNSYTYRSVR